MKEIENASLFMFLSGIVAAPLALSLPSKPLQALCGTSFFLILPGYGIISSFYASKLNPLEKGLASLCVSIVLIPFVAFILERLSGDVIRIYLISSYLILLCVISFNPARLRQLRKPISNKHGGNSKFFNQHLRLLRQGLPTTVYLTISYVLFFVNPRRFWDDEVGADLPAIKDVFSGDWAFIMRPFERPLVTWPLEIGHYFFGLDEFSARAVFIAAGGITILSTYLLATQLFGESTGWNASLILATLPSQIAWSGITRHAVIMTPFYVLSIHFFYKSIKQREPKHLYLSSICAICSYMASEIALLLIPTFVLYALISRSLRSLPRKHVIASASLFGVAYLVTQSIQRLPFDLFMYGRIMQAYFSEWVSSSIPRISETYFAYVFNSNPLLIFFSLIGLPIFVRRGRRAEVLCSAWLSIYALSLFANLKVRSFYALPLLPVLCIIVSCLISNELSKDQIRHRFLHIHLRYREIKLAFLSLILLSNIFSIPYVFSESRTIAPELWNATYDAELFDFLRRETSPLDIILMQPSYLSVGWTTPLQYQSPFSFYTMRPVAQLDRLYPNPPYLFNFTLDYSRQTFGERNIFYVSVDKREDAYIGLNFPGSYKVYDNKYTVQKLLSSNDYLIIHKSGGQFVVQSRFLKVIIGDTLIVFYIWEPWSDGLYLDRLWCEMARMRFTRNLEINIDDKLNDKMTTGLILLKDRLKIELKNGESLLRMTVHSNKPIIDLEIENSSLADGSQSIDLKGELVGNAVVSADRPTIRYISQGGVAFERIRREVYSMDKASLTVLGLASKFDQNVMFKPINSDANLDCRNYPSFDVSMNRSSLKRGVACLRMAFLSGDSTIDSDMDGVLDILQDTPPAGYKNRWDTKDNCQTLARWTEED